MWAHAAALRSKTEGNRQVERLKQFHLVIEPVLCTGPVEIGPTQSGAQLGDTKIAQNADGAFQPVIFKVKPLTDAECGSVFGKAVKRKLRASIFAK